MNNDFCFPIRISIVNPECHRWVCWLIYSVTSICLIISNNLTLLLLGSCTIVVSIKLSIHKNSIIENYTSLIGTGESTWYLVRANGERSSINICQAQIIGPILFIAIKRFGESYQLITSVYHQKPDQWHRIRVFIQYHL